jgi:hypothetical protein
MNSPIRLYGLCLTFAACIGFSTPVHAQLSAGLLGGINLSSFWGKDAQHPDMLLGYRVAGFITVPLVGSVAFQPEIGFTLKGSENVSSSAGSTVRAEARLYYVEAPLLLRAELLSGDRGPGLGILGGVAIAVNTAAWGTVADNLQTFVFPLLNVRRFDTGIVFGGDVRWPAGPGTFVLDVRYVLGLRSFDTSPEGFIIYNRVLSVSVGYAL